MTALDFFCVCFCELLYLCMLVSTFFPFAFCFFSGGALVFQPQTFATVGQLNVYGCYFINNTAQSFGGAIYTQGMDLTIEQSYFTASPNLRCLLCRRRLYCGGRWTQIGKKDVISKRLRVYCLVTIPKFLPFYSWIKYFNLLSSSWRYKCLIWGLIIQ